MGDKIESESSFESTKIVIVGAGIAGLAAARTLEKFGFQDYILLEAQNVVGGRSQTIFWNNECLELGAQFLHGDQSHLGQLCLDRNLISTTESWDGEGSFIRDDGMELDSKLLKEVRDIVDSILTECEGYASNNEIAHMDIKQSVGTILHSRFAKHLKIQDYEDQVRETMLDIFDWHIRYLKIDNACSRLDELSAKKWGDFKVAGGPEYLVFKNGYKSLLDSIVSELSEGNLRLNSPVALIQQTEHSPRPLLITLKNHQQIVADCAIVTSSLGYLKKHHKQMFRPELPSNLTTAIEHLGFGLINKIFLDFGEPWWEKGSKGFQLIWRRNISSHSRLPKWTKDLTGFDVLGGHHAILLGWVSGKGAHILENLSEQQISEDCVSLLRMFLRRNDIPAAKKCIRTCWQKNEFVVGGYSHVLANCNELDVSPGNLLEPVWRQLDNEKKVPSIMLAGEAASDNYYSTTHGAYQTGVKQAQVFLTWLNKMC